MLTTLIYLAVFHLSQCEDSSDSSEDRSRFRTSFRPFRFPPPGFIIPDDDRVIGRSFESCFDKSPSCEGYKSYCKYDSIKEYCQKTCGVCGPSTPVCKDDGSWCDFYKDGCDLYDWVRVECRVTCNTCPESGKWGPFGEWGTCSQSCDGGTHRRTRNCEEDPCEGKDYEEKSCNLQPCAIWGPFGEYGPCSVTCGVGEQWKSRECKVGNCVGESRLKRICNTQKCPGVWGSFGEYGPCSKTCGGGVQTKTRVCEKGDCIGKDSEDRSCNDHICSSKSCKDGSKYCEPYKSLCPESRGFRKMCPKACDLCSDQVEEKTVIWSDWSEWGQCSEECDGGKRRRERYCGGGDGDCEGKPFEEEKCNTEACIEWGEWTLWTECSQSCNGGGRTRKRECISRRGCDGDRYEKEECNTNRCPEPKRGVWANWTTWTRCSRTCGGGTRGRKRYCVGDGSCDGDTYQQERCNEFRCRSRDGWTEYGSWSSCSRSCLGGVQSRRRKCRWDRCSGSSVEQRKCNTGECCTDPKWADWSSWSRCSSPCSGGISSRYRRCIKAITCPDSVECKGDSRETENCNKDKCDDGCSKGCGTGVSASKAIDLKGNRYVRYSACNKRSCPQSYCTSGYAVKKDDADGNCCKISTAQCGVPKFQEAESRIIGGDISKEKEFPWQAFISPSNCGGAIIHKNWVLTAAHCLLIESQNWTPRRASSLKVIVGKIFIPRSARDSAEENVESYEVHKDFDFPRHDIAIVKMKRSFVWTDHVMPVCLPASSGFTVPDDATAIVTGFGMTHNDRFMLSDSLRDAAVEKFNFEVCEEGYRNDYYRLQIIKSEKSMLCAGSVDGTVDSCSGDSGSPLVYQSDESCSFILVGLVSIGPSPCAKSETPGLYTKVAFYLGWIKSQMKSDSAFDSFFKF